MASATVPVAAPAGRGLTWGLWAFIWLLPFHIVAIAALFGVVLLSERLGWIGWTGCAVMLTGIVIAEPAAAPALRRLVGRPAAA